MEAILPFMNNFAMILLVVFSLVSAWALLTGRGQAGGTLRTFGGPALLIVGLVALVAVVRHFS